MLHFFFEINRSKPFGGVSTKYVLGGCTTTPPMVFCGHKWLDLAPNGGLKPTARRA